MRKHRLQGASIIDNTGARKNPVIVVGDYNGFSSGEMLDANAIVQMIKDLKIPSYNPGSGYHTNPETGELEETTIEMLQNDIEQTAAEVQLIKEQILNIIGSAPENLDTLEEIAQSITNINEYHEQPKVVVDDEEETLIV